MDWMCINLLWAYFPVTYYERTCNKLRECRLNCLPAEQNGITDKNVVVSISLRLSSLNLTSVKENGLMRLHDRVCCRLMKYNQFKNVNVTALTDSMHS